MGGLVARWYIERCGGAQLTRKLITIGTPYRGSAKALEQLVNGVPRRIGPFAVNLTEFARSLPSLHQLLPEYACITHHGDLAKTTEIAVPTLCKHKIDDAMHFHTELHTAELNRPGSLTATHAIVGINQPTPTTAEITGGRVVPKDSYRTDDLFGDSTVPLLGACRSDVPMDSNTLRRVPDKHGNLQRNRTALDELEGILAAKSILVRAANTIELRVAVPELHFAGEELPIAITVLTHTRVALLITIYNEAGNLIHTRAAKGNARTITVRIGALAPGAYTIDVRALDRTTPVAPVSSDVLVWG
jgi:hypothetical protein